MLKKTDRAQIRKYDSFVALLEVFQRLPQVVFEMWHFITIREKECLHYRFIVDTGKVKLNVRKGPPIDSALDITIPSQTFIEI